MLINFDSEYKQLRIPNCQLSRQYISRSPRLVFTILYRQEFTKDFDKRAYHLRNRDGVYIGVGDNSVYVGISDRNKNGILGRIANHMADKGKDYIKYFIIITSADPTDESYDTNVITTLEHILRQWAVYTNRSQVMNTGVTHYVLKNDIFKMKDFLQAYGVIYDMLRDRNITALLPVDTSLNVGEGENIYTLDGGSVRVKLLNDQRVLLFKNNTFDLPSNSLMDDVELDTTFRNLLKANVITIAPPVDNVAKILITQDIILNTVDDLKDFTYLILNEEIENYKELWTNNKGISLDNDNK